MKIRAAKKGESTSRACPSFLPAACAFLLTFCGLAAAAAPATPAPARPPAGTAVASEVREIGPLLDPARSAFPVVGQGGNYSIPLEKGGSLWVFNNVWTGEVKDGGDGSLWGIVDGGVAVLNATSPWTAAGGFRYQADENGWPLPLFSANLSEFSPVRKFWPKAPLKTPSGYCAFYSLMNNFGPGGGDFFRVGQGVACSQTPLGPYAPLKYNERYALWNDIEPSFGSAVWTDADGWVYVYGRYMTEPGTSAIALARVKPGGAASRENYFYYTLETSPEPWTQDVTEVSPVMEEMPEEFSVSYNDYLKAYLSLYSDPATGGAMMRTAQYPWGPWDEPRTVLACGKEEYCFGAKEQTVFRAEGGKRVFFTLERKNAPYLYELTFE